MYRILSRIVLLAACIQLITGCAGSTREILGLRKVAPDEFKVISNPPLSLPPEFYLMPPVPEKDVTSDAEQAKILLFEKTSADIVVPDTETTAGESVFLNRAGADDANPQIKEILEEEKKQREQAKKEKSLLKKIAIFSSDTDKSKEESIVNARQERERIARNKKEGEPVTKGETPTVNNNEKGFLKEVFGF